MQTERELYITLVSDASCSYYPDNTTEHFQTRLPREFNLQGSWVVGLCELSFPTSFLHINRDEGDVYFGGHLVGSIKCGIYPETESIVLALNEIVKEHLKFIYDRETRFVTVNRICTPRECELKPHCIKISDKVKRILGLSSEIIETMPQVGKLPASIVRALPDNLFVYCDNCSPHIIGDTSRQVLRVVPFNADGYKYGMNFTVSFIPHYFPIQRQTFQNIEIDIKDERMEPIPFTYGPSYVTLHFMKVD